MKKIKLIVLTLLISLFFSGFLIGFVIKDVYTSATRERTMKFAGEIFLDDFNFTFKNKTEMKNALGTVYNWHGQKGISILDGLSENDFLRVCNHEILHVLLKPLNLTLEEEYVDVLDDYVRFKTCDELDEMIK